MSKQRELGDGEPSPDSKLIGRTIYNHENQTVKFVRSGAAQEVSPPSPEPILVIAEQIVDKLVLSLCDAHISEQRHAGLVSETVSLISQAEGDTRELKAALNRAKELIEPLIETEGEMAPEWDTEAKEFLAEVERLLG